MHLPRALTSVAWIALYLLAALGPVALMLVPPVPSGRAFWVELSVAFGFVGLTQIGLQFVLIARFQRLTAPYGIDVVLKYHRQIAVVAVALVLAHPLLLLLEQPERIVLFNPLGGTVASKAGLASLTLLLVLVATSIGRERLHIGYEAWRVMHALLGVAALALAQVHISMAGLYVNTTWKHAFWIASSGLLLSLVAYLRLVKPALQRRRPWRVVGVTDEGGDTFRLDVEPVGHDGFRFAPGQFAWIKVAGSPYSVDEHPYSFASSAEQPGRLTFGIKAVGDFSRAIARVEKGASVYVDGPHGAFSIDRAEAPGYVFIAGGVGITPFMSILHTMADRGDPRPVTLLYSSVDEAGLAFREEIEALKRRLDLTVEYVLDEPPHDWPHEEGQITHDLLERLLPRERFRRRMLLCGPPPMMAAVEEALLAQGVPQDHIYLEQFALA